MYYTIRIFRASRESRIPHPAVVSFCSCPVLLTRELSGLVSCYPLGLWFSKERGNRRRGGGKVGIAGGDFQGAVGVAGNLGLVFRNFHGPVFSTAFGVAPDHVRAISNRDRLIQVFVNGHRLARQSVSPAALVDLPPAVFDRYRVVFVHHTFRLDREDPVQIAASAATKRRTFFGSLDGELLVELGDVALAEKLVGFSHRGDRSQP